jgi:long-subunit acyl-CoA synthetase (AMP-forming)
VEAPRLLPLAEKMFGLVKGKLGLDRARYCATGAAPISRDLVEYFASLGILIFEVFGQSECTGVSTANCPTAWKVCG